MEQNKSRRQFLKGMIGGVGVAIATRLSNIFPEGQFVHAQEDPSTVNQEQIEQGELYAGFVLLPAVDSPRPSFVQCAPAPILHGDEKVDPAYIGETLKFATVDALIEYISFPIYVPASLPLNIQFLGGDVLQFAGSKEIFMVTLNYGDNPAGQALIRMRTRPIYPRPYPVRPVHHPVNFENEIVPPEKVDFTPSPGVMRPNAFGHKIQWIEQDILYSLVANHDSSREAAEDLARSLVRIG